MLSSRDERRCLGYRLDAVAAAALFQKGKEGKRERERGRGMARIKWPYLEGFCFLPAENWTRVASMRQSPFGDLRTPHMSLMSQPAGERESRHG